MRVHTHMHTHTHGHERVRARARRHTHKHTHTHACVRAHTHAHTHTHTTTTQHHTAGPENGLIHTKTEEKRRGKPPQATKTSMPTCSVCPLHAISIRTIQRRRPTRVVHSVVTNDGTLSSSLIIGPAMTLRSHRENSKTKTATVFTSRRGIQWQSRTCWPVLPALQCSVLTWLAVRGLIVLRTPLLSPSLCTSS